MLSLVADYNTTSSSSTSSEGDDTENEEEQQKQSQKDKQLPAKPQLLLPSANLLLSTGPAKTAGEVFSNPFLEAEKLEIDKLQKHVKMVDSENHLLQKNGRKICWSNRRGRCRFGNKCKYAHDSDLVEATNMDGQQGERQQINKELKSASETTITISKPAAYKEPTILDLADSNELKDKSKNRKRPGLGDSIVPGKRVMKTYHHTKKTS